MHIKTLAQGEAQTKASVNRNCYSSISVIWILLSSDTACLFCAELDAMPQGRAE